MFKPLFAIVFIICCVSCNQKKESNTSEWVEKDYRVEELIFEFQEMISPELFELAPNVEKQPWLCESMTWGAFKVTQPDSINSPTKFSKCRGEDGPITPGIYFCTLVSTADSDGEFSKGSWNSLDWKESILTNYSDTKCAQLMLAFVEDALIDGKMNKTWQTNKPHWIKAIKRIASRSE